MRRHAITALCLWAVTLGGCSSATSSATAVAPVPQAIAGGSLPAGTWGGNGVRMTVDDGSVSVEFDCGRGGIDSRPAFDAAGRFQASGYYVQERGGPLRANSADVREQATFSAVREGSRLTLTVKVPGRGLELGPVVLEEGNAGRLHKCV